ncbi:chorismate mutase [Rhizorhabdus dicambivorans]|uniref:chorismate mutase n=1 Tax=Rhizorhabdus dicambivorans TaxID=1850238 RepID=A0A2A4FWF6_9SPHN|nr:chorismate mutase [Rhizorhabdus dicambivorans]PCE42515.1 hypothetical protein COO09_08835 [Rhizorhabdus dicambivorans]
MTDQTLAELERIRKDIESLDHDIVALVARRLDLCRAVAPLKMSAGLEAHIPHRVQLVIDRWMSHAVERGINPELMRSICGQIIAEGETLQIEKMQQAESSS